LISFSTNHQPDLPGGAEEHQYMWYELKVLLQSAEQQDR
jgi:hypothetical protein